MSIRSGELVIISRVKFKIVPKCIKSLQLRIAVLLVLFAAAACVTMKGSVLKSFEQHTVAVRTAEIQNQCTILSNQLINSNYLEQRESEIIAAEITQLSNIYNGRVVVIDDEFRIVEDTYNLQEGKTIVSEDVVKCFRGERTSSYDAENRYIEIATPIMDTQQHKVLGIILVSAPTENIRSTIAVLEEKASLTEWTIIFIGMGLAGVIGMVLANPLRKMAHAIEEMTEGYGLNDLHENTYNETGQLSEAFNRLRERYQVLDASREEFVANVSHELKTPLTSMKVLADSLLAQPDAPVELYREFMGDLSEEIERENKIINDLLSLVKLDKKGANLNVKSENINELVERILKRLRPLAVKQNIELVFESFRPVTAEVDEVKLALAVTNLVENAIKYNRENGWVHVSLNADHKFFYLKVADNGIGIPKEDMDNIFERFYRVDKSHSREIGGTGLGLSIARNAVIMHRGAVRVHSEPGEGTTFTIRIPLTLPSIPK